MKQQSLNSKIKVITEMALDLYDLTRDSSYSSTDTKMFAYIEILGILRNTNEDHEYDRIARLYRMRKKRGLI